MTDVSTWDAGGVMRQMGEYTAEFAVLERFATLFDFQRLVK